MSLTNDLIDLLVDDTKSEELMKDYGYEDHYKDDLERLGIEWAQVQHVGGEGEGNTYYSVFKFSRGEEFAYVKFHGWYASYDGANYEGWSFVQPKIVEEIKYV